MELVNQHLLSVIVFFPLLWGALSLIFPKAFGVALPKMWALFGSLISFALSVLLYVRFTVPGAEFQFREIAPWIQTLGINYDLGTDGISLWLIVLTNFLMPLAIWGSFQGIDKREKEYYFFLQFLQTGMLGAFVALDVFLFYVFWELMLIPMYLLIGIWGGKERIYAATKFFIYTVVGSLIMLVAIFYLAYQYKLQFGQYSMSLLDFYQLQLGGDGYFSVQGLLFLSFALAFAIKVPLFPLHTWLPDAHVQAPTAGSVILAGVLLKLGGYGFIRFAFPLFPDAVALYQLPFLILGAIAIVYGAWVAMVQPDIKKLVAYSSVSHMGYVVIGLFSLTSIGVTGSVYQMLNHGISTGALFLLVGMIYERRHTREIEAFGGLAKVMPLYTVVFMIVTLSSVALPGTNGFIGEFLILLGTWQTNRIIAVIGGLGVIFGAVYMLWMFQRAMYGEIKHEENKGLKDLSAREISIMAPLVVLIFVMGVYPNFFFKKMEPAIGALLSKATTLRAKATAQTAMPPVVAQEEQ